MINDLQLNFLRLMLANVLSLGLLKYLILDDVMMENKLIIDICK